MTTTTEQPTARAGATNEPVELGRYTLASGERVIQGQRVLGVVITGQDRAAVSLPGKVGQGGAVTVVGLEPAGPQLPARGRGL